MSCCSSMITFCGAFSAVIVAHEAGHYLAARRCGVLVSEFSLGFPFTPVILRLGRYQETDFTVRLLPFGGFIKPGAASAEEDSADVFEALSPGQKAFIMVAGSLVNLAVGAALLLTAIMAVRGLGLLDSLLVVWALLTEIVAEIARIVAHGDIGAMAGPVGTAAVSAKILAEGFWPTVGFCGLMSISIGIMNLLPVPGFDGWHLLVAGVEVVRGKPLGRRFQAVMGAFGLLSVTILMVVVTYHDVLRLLRGSG